MRWAAAGDQGKDETRRELAATAEQQDLPLEVFVRPGHTPERVGLPWPDDDDGDDGDDDGDECDDKDDHTYFDDDDGGTGSTAEQRKQAWSYPQREQAPVAAAEPKAGRVGGQRAVHRARGAEVAQPPHSGYRKLKAAFYQVARQAPNME